MRKMHAKSHLIFIVILSFICVSYTGEWGFYGHKLINEKACYTLPSDLFGFFKKNVTYLREKATAPDMRRYAIKKEAGRHYIDIDHWGDPPFERLPRKWDAAFFKMLEIKLITSALDTVLVKPTGVDMDIDPNFFYKNIQNKYFSDEWSLDCEWYHTYMDSLADCKSLIYTDSLTIMGILPYSLVYNFHQLKNAFYYKQNKRILKLAADIGHYIADAHVPLHTTVNYNGQLTGQDGIHAFWESRIPELFAEDHYDFLVGQADYIEDIHTYFWDIILDTHSYVDDVLALEMKVRNEFPADKQNCFVERAGVTSMLECADFARAYSDALKGMVERQMAKSIKAIGDVWFTAWVDAGQPILDSIVTSNHEIDSFPSYPDLIHH